MSGWLREERLLRDACRETRRAHSREALQQTKIAVVNIPILEVVRMSQPTARDPVPVPVPVPVPLPVAVHAMCPRPMTPGKR